MVNQNHTRRRAGAQRPGQIGIDEVAVVSVDIDGFGHQTLITWHCILQFFLNDPGPARTGKSPGSLRNTLLPAPMGVNLREVPRLLLVVTCLPAKGVLRKHPMNSVFFG